MRTVPIYSVRAWSADLQRETSAGAFGDMFTAINLARQIGGKVYEVNNGTEHMLWPERATPSPVPPSAA